MVRRLPLAVLGAVCLAAALAPATSAAQPRKGGETSEEKAEKQACIDAHGEGQSLQRDGKLTLARERFVTCGRESCPNAIRRDCTEWLASATASQPSVVIEARDEAGKATTDVRVFVDDVQMAGALDGRALEIDPGSRDFRYVSRKGSVLEERLVILEGQKNRKLLAVFPRAAVPPPPYRVPTVSWVFAAIGVGALANFVVWGAKGSNDESILDGCKPRCSQDDADIMYRDYALADVSLLLALGAFGGAAAFAIAARSPSAPADETPRASLQVGPGSLQLRGTF